MAKKLDLLQKGSTDERSAIKAHVKRLLSGFFDDYYANLVLPDVRTVLADLERWISKREKRTDKKPSGL